jgi:putative Holliday junction resolvase
MAVIAHAEIKAALPAGGRLLGLDVGDKTIGLAISDSGLAVASPIETITRGKFAADGARLFKLIDERGVGGLIIGLPVNMDGRRCATCRSRSGTNGCRPRRSNAP